MRSAESGSDSRSNVEDGIATFEQHMGEHWAQEYLDELALVGN